MAKGGEWSRNMEMLQEGQKRMERSRNESTNRKPKSRTVRVKHKIDGKGK